MQPPHVHLATVPTAERLHSLRLPARARDFRHRFRRLAPPVTIGMSRLCEANVDWAQRGGAVA